MVLGFAALLLSLLIVAVSDGIAAAGGVLGLVCLALLGICGCVIAYYKAQKSSEDEDGERLPPALVVVLIVIVFICLAFATFGKLYEEGIDVSEWFPLTRFSTLTVMGPFLIILFVVIYVVDTFIQGRLKPKLGAWASRFKDQK